jgi:uncharacterized protein YdbL (DUF1318 family)
MPKALGTAARALAAFLVVFAMLAAAPPGHAQSARELKATGLVGETINGYLGLVHGSADAGIVQAVDTINAQRRKVYQEDATRTGRPLSEVEAVAGAQLRERAGSGDWIQNAAKEWVQKP